jgi:hypothetical protein
MSRLALLVAGLLLLWPDGAAARDFPSHCSSDSPRWLFLIDRTDNYDEIDKSRLAHGAAQLFEVLTRRAEASPKGVMFEVFGISDKPGNLQAEWRSCVPGCRLSDGTRDCGDVLMLRDRKQFHGAFIKILAPYIRETNATGASEILRSLYTLSNEYEGRKVERLIIFSDMIEYSDINEKVSRFSQSEARAAFNQIRNKGLAPLPTFKGTEVQVFGPGKRLGQDLKEQQYGKSMILDTSADKAFQSFWKEYFTRLAQAGSVTIKHEFAE